MERENLGKLIYNSSLLKGKFLLKSGEISNFYFDKFVFETDPVLLKSIAEHAAKMLPGETGLIAGPELGGVALVTALSLETGIRSVFVRKENKTYGTLKIIEGPDVNTKLVCVTEDIVTTGGTTLETVQKLRSAGALVNTVICIINRNPKTIKILRNEGLELRFLFSLDKLGRLQIQKT